MEGEMMTDTAVSKFLGKSRSWVYEQEKRDATFPKKVRIPGSVCGTARRRSEIMAWLDSLDRVTSEELHVGTNRYKGFSLSIPAILDIDDE